MSSTCGCAAVTAARDHWIAEAVRASKLRTDLRATFARITAERDEAIRAGADDVVVRLENTYEQAALAVIAATRAEALAESAYERAERRDPRAKCSECNTAR